MDIYARLNDTRSPLNDRHKIAEGQRYAAERVRDMVEGHALAAEEHVAKWHVAISVAERAATEAVELTPELE